MSDNNLLTVGSAAATLDGERARADADSPMLGVKVLLVANTGWYLRNFRAGLIRGLQRVGAEVVAACPYDSHVEWLKDCGVRHHTWRLSRSGMNPLVELAAIQSLCRIYRQERPSFVHHFTVKPILYGTAAARLSGVQRVVNSVTGLGHVFLSDRLAARLVRPFIRRWYAGALSARGGRAVFQNRDDLMLLAESCPELAASAILTRGSGVDLERFHPAATDRQNGNGQKCALFVGRLLHEKGIREFVEASRLSRQRWTDSRFLVCGSPDPGNPSSVAADTLEQWKREGTVEFLGHVDRIEQHIAQADVVVLPSYREGTPRVLLEAAAMAKAIVATDVPGCREVVGHGENGLLVPPRDPVSLADAIEELFVDDSLRADFGRAGRRRMKERFDERFVVKQTMRVYDELLRGEETESGRMCERARRRGGETARGRRGKTISVSGSGPSTLDPRPSSLTPDSGGTRRLDKGVLVISLDLELAWGTRGRPAARHVGPFLDGTRDAIRGLLGLFATYGVSATWAVVGALLMGSREAGRRHAWLADRSYDDVPSGDSSSEPFWYAEDVLESLVEHNVPQEIACHTLTHRFVDASSAGREAFRRELRLFRELFDELYLEQPTTFIFPKAKMGHFDVLAEEGFRCIRGPESGWFESLPGVLGPAAFRLLDAKLACRPRVDRPRRTNEGLWVVPSSQFYSPFLSVGSRVSIDERVRKAIKGLRWAARHRRVFHLWTHPFNLGMGTDDLLGGLDRILREARRLSETEELDIASMGQLVDQLDSCVHEPVRNGRSQAAFTLQ